MSSRISTVDGRTSSKLSLVPLYGLWTRKQGQRLEVVPGLTQCFTAQSMSTDALLSVPWASDLLLLSRVDLDDLWNFQLPTEYVPGTSRPTVDVVPTIYVLTSDSAMALITGRGRTLKKYTSEKDLASQREQLK